MLFQQFDLSKYVMASCASERAQLFALYASHGVIYFYTRGQRGNIKNSYVVQPRVMEDEKEVFCCSFFFC